MTILIHTNWSDKDYRITNHTNLFVGTFSSSFIQVNVGLFQYNVWKPSTDTLDGGHGEHDFTFAIDVGTEDTQNVLELFRNDQRLKNTNQQSTAKETNSEMHVNSPSAVRFRRMNGFRGHRIQQFVLPFGSHYDSNRWKIENKIRYSPFW